MPMNKESKANRMANQEHKKTHSHKT